MKTTWRTHSCVPCSHSCERFGIGQKRVRMSSNGVTMGLPTLRATAGVFNGERRAGRSASEAP